MVYFKEYFKGYPPGGGRWSQESLYWQPVSSSKEVVVGRGLKGLFIWVNILRGGGGGDFKDFWQN